MNIVGLDASKNNLHGRLLLKGDSPLKLGDLRNKLLKLWKRLGPHTESGCDCGKNKHIFVRNEFSFGFKEQVYPFQMIQVMVHKSCLCTMHKYPILLSTPTKFLARPQISSIPLEI
jgi:hypothetical protein